MTPTLDPMASTTAEDAADDDASFGLTEVCALSAVRRARIPARLRPHLASGHLVIDVRGRVLRARVRLAFRAARSQIASGTCIVLHRGAQTVRLPFA